MMSGHRGRPNDGAIELRRSDVLLAIAVALGSLGLSVARPAFDDAAASQPWWSYVFPVAAALALIFRRVGPVVALVAIVGIVVINLLVVADPGPIFLPILIGLYSVASHGDRRTSILVAAFAAVLVSAAALTIAPDGPSVLGFGGALLLTIIPILIGDAVRSRRALIAETDKRVRLAEESLKQDARQQVLDERVRIARELHDVVAHSIATINVQAGMAAHVIDDEPAAAREALVEIKESSKSALAELRSMLGVLRGGDEDTTPLTPSPGIADVSSLIDRYVGTISYGQVGIPATEVDPVVGLIIYRVVQESLTNVMKHAVDAAVEVRLEYLSDLLTIKIADSGGQVMPLSTGTGLGLVGLTERVRAVGGSFSAAARFDGGFTVEAELPYVPQSPTSQRTGAMT